jgi:hypothetical protein
MAMKYKKNKNTSVFQQLEEYLQVTSIQNYIPIYNRFFTMNKTNWNSINLEHSHVIDKLTRDNDIFYSNGNPIFFKFSPLLDPLKYLTGSYDSYDFTLPTPDHVPHPKLNDVNNSSYVDGFFYYLSNQLLQKNFLHGTAFYGSYLGIKQDFCYNLYDDVSHLEDSEYFHKNRGNLFELDKAYEFSDSRKYKKELKVSDEPVELVLDSLETFESDDTSVESNSCLDDMHAIIKKFPVQLIAMEKCENTLDSLLEDISPEELTACLMQVILTLLTYQKVYKFTHNDLHTNNIMYVNTNVEYLYYTFQNVHYKVPTFGKLYKIIDYGRAIYTFQNNRFVSDSFHEEGDAATQYNMEPYFDCSEPIIEANYSFDLCRLSCSILEGVPEEGGIYSVVEEWSLDDNGDSVMMNEFGNERYPDFELYRMIARTVHNHTPEAQLKRPIFAAYEIDVVNEPHMNIDSY